MQSYLWLIPILPLLGAVINGGLALASAKSPTGPNRGFISLVAVLLPALSFALVVAASLQLGRIPHVEGNAAPALLQSLWTWLAVGAFQLKLGFLFDGLSSLMLLFITGIGTLITLYSVGYMWTDRGFARFMAYLNLFLFSMIVLVLGDSLVATFLGWEGVGLCSYLLVGFWHQNHEYNGAAVKAFVVNRVGDLGFLLGMFILAGVVGALDYRTIAAFFQSDNPGIIALVEHNKGILAAGGLLLFLGCCGKSAQIPLVTWLPDAMAGPTPVSALIHAATMVTSGVYLLARLGDFYVHIDPAVLQIVLVIGCATALWGAIAGLFQNDIKKALAYSTVSQLGFMFMACGVGAFDVGLFHVYTHAFFKATLFLGAGMIIHLLHHEQDMRKMGGLWYTKNPATGVVVCAGMAFAWWAILGLPLGSGFFSKDLILERLAAGHGWGIAVFVVALLTAFITAVYMTRVMLLTFWSPSRLTDEQKAHQQPIPFTMQLPVLLLGIGSLVCGAMVWNQAPGMALVHVTSFPTWLAPVLADAQHHLHPTPAGGEHHGLISPLMVTILATVGAIIGALFAYSLWRRGPTGATVEQVPHSAPTGFGAVWTWLWDYGHDAIAKLAKALGTVLYWFVELGVIAVTTFLIGAVTSIMGGGLVGIQRARLRSLMAISLIGAVAILFALFWNT